MAAPGFFRAAVIVLAKDLRIELATKEVTTTASFFAVLVVVISSLSFLAGNAGAVVAPGAMWVSIAFASVLAISRSWSREREESALFGLLVSPLSRPAIFVGKALGILTFLAIVEAFVLPTAALLFGLDLLRLGPSLLVVAACASPGIAASGTLFGAMTVRTRARDLVLAIVLFPLLSPTLLAAVAATREVVQGAGISELSDYLLLMGAFDLVFWLGGTTLFGALVEG